MARRRLVAGVIASDPPPFPAIDVPSLAGTYAQPRLLDDGRAHGVHDVFARWNAAGRHGRTAALTSGQLNDLSAFLLSLPESEEAAAQCVSSRPPH